MTHLVLVRGIQGSGKTTFATTHYPQYVHWETDKLCMKNGVYVFEPAMVKNNHIISQLYVDQLLKQGMNVVVSNTFSTLWEMEPYLKMLAHKSIFRMTTPIEVCLSRQVHNVPEETVHKVAARFQNYPGEVLINGQ